MLSLIPQYFLFEKDLGARETWFGPYTIHNVQVNFLESLLPKRPVGTRKVPKWY